MIAQNLITTIAIGYFLCISIISIKYFRISDPSAKKGRQFISFLVSIASFTTVWCLWTNPPVSLISQIVAAALYLYALFMFLWAWQSNRSKSFDFAFSSKEPGFISQNGPYRWVRHPFYSSYCSSWVASILATSSVVVAAMGLVLITTYIVAAKKEEGIFNTSNLSNEYKEYTKRAGILFPKISFSQLKSLLTRNN